MDAALKFAYEHGFVMLFAVSCLLGIGWITRTALVRLSDILGTYFRSDGIIAQWFVSNQQSQEQIAKAVEAMPRAIESLQESADQHHERMEAAIAALVATDKEHYQDVCQFHKMAAAPDSMFSTRGTNKAMLHLLKSAKGYLDHYISRDDVVQCKDLTLAESQLDEAIRTLDCC